MVTSNTIKKYKAFISYRHSELGRRHAVALESALKKYAKPLFTRPYKIFRDEKHMAPNIDLSSAIKEGLEQSDYLIFIAEEGSASSIWCQQEIEYWCGPLDRTEKLIIVHVADSIHMDVTNNTVDWEKSNALPILLKNYISSIPLYTDLQELQSQTELILENPRYNSKINSIAAKLRNVSPEELNDDALHIHRRNLQLRNGAIAILFMMLLLSLFTSIFAWQKKQEADINAEQAKISEASAIESAQAARDSAEVTRQQRSFALLQQKLAEEARDSTKIEQQNTIEALKNEEKERIRADYNANYAMERQKHAELQTQIALGNDLSYKANLLLEQGDVTGAFHLAAFVHQFIDTSNNCQAGQVILDSYYYNNYKSKNKINIKIGWYRNFIGHNSGVNSVATSPDGNYIVSGGNDKLVRLWKASTGVEIQCFKGHKSGINFVTISPDGNYIISISNDYTVKIWNINIGLEIQSSYLKNQFIKKVIFLPNSSQILTGNSEGVIKLWEINTGKEISRYEGHKRSIYSLAISPNGNYFLSGSDDKTLKLWNLKTGDELHSSQEHKTFVSSLSFSPGGEYFLSSSWDKMIVWRLSSLEKIRIFETNSYAFMASCFAPHPQFILTGGGLGKIKIWDINSGLDIQTFKGHRGSTSSISFSPNAEYFVTGGSDGVVKLWNVANNMNVQHFEKHNSSIQSVAISSDGRYFLTGSSDKTAKLWKSDFEKEIISFEGFSSYVTSVDFSTNGERILLCDRYGKMEIWDSKKIKKIKSIDLNLAISSAEISPNGKFILAGSLNSRAILWDINKGKEVKRFEGHGSFINAAIFSPDGSRILTGAGSPDETVKLWDVTSGKEIKNFVGHSEGINSLSFSSDGNFFLTGSKDKKAKLWDVEKGIEIQSFVGHTSDINSVSFSSDGNLVLTGSDDKTIRIWDRSGKTLSVIGPINDKVYSCKFTPDGNSIIFGGRDGILRLWQINIDNIIKQVTLNDHITSLSLDNLEEFRIIEILESIPNGWKLILESQNEFLLYSLGLYLQNLTKNNKNPVYFNYYNSIAENCFQKAIEISNVETYSNQLTALYSNWSQNLYETGDFVSAAKKANMSSKLNSLIIKE